MQKREDTVKLIEKDKLKTRAYALLALITLVVGGCTTIQIISNSLRPSPWEQYSKNLERSDLGTTVMAHAWREAGDPQLHDSVLVNLPFQETGFFPAGEPQARFYRFEAKAGQVLTLTSVVKAKEDAQIFAELFIKESEEWESIAFADSSRSLTFEFKSGTSCLVRLQPELLVNAYYSITLSVTPVLMTPVKGASNKSIGSYFGDPRDGGKRKHEGIDIFAPRGTPVIAPTAGIITRVGTSNLGGKTIWMSDLKRGHSYYFAHLDSQIVKAGMKVKQGDVLGTVGNTGNAQYTPSHLHFGVYQRESKDPIAYIRTMERLVRELAPDTLFQSVVLRANQKVVDLHAGPSSKFPVRQKIGKGTYLKLIAQSPYWYRVITADHQEGFAEKKKVIAADKGTKVSIKETSLLLSDANADAVPVGELAPQVVEALAAFQNYRFVKTMDGSQGWISL